MIQQQKDRLHEQEIAIYAAEVARVNNDLDMADRQIGRLTRGLQTTQDMLEATGAVNTDRDDVLDTYRRRR
jgi:hypothetical protein